MDHGMGWGACGVRARDWYPETPRRRLRDSPGAKSKPGNSGYQWLRNRRQVKIMIGAALCRNRAWPMSGASLREPKAAFHTHILGENSVVRSVFLY
jgi:hypothetical protein